MTATLFGEYRRPGQVLWVAKTRSRNRTATEAGWGGVLPTEAGPRSWCQTRGGWRHRPASTRIPLPPMLPAAWPRSPRAQDRLRCLAPGVAVMQAADPGRLTTLVVARRRCSTGRPDESSCLPRIRSVYVVVGDERPDQLPQVAIVEDDDVVEKSWWTVPTNLSATPSCRGSGNWCGLAP